MSSHADWSSLPTARDTALAPADLVLFGGTAAAWPLPGHSQQSVMPGFLGTGSKRVRWRSFIAALTVAAAAWALPASAQQTEKPAPPKEPSSDDVFVNAKAAVNAKLKDPQSARYGDMVRKVGPSVNGKPAEVVCGSVNAKEPSGRYGRNRSFVYFIADGATFLAEQNPMPEDVAQIIYARFCK